MKFQPANSMPPAEPMSSSRLGHAHGNLKRCAPGVGAGFADSSQAVAVALKVTDAARLLAIALSRWENEGGSDAEGLPATSGAEALGSPPLTNAEVVQLRIRVIALENVVIALLADAPVDQLKLVREMAAYIAPRQGYTPHPMTLRAADEMLSLVDRADRFSPPPTS